VDESSRDIFYIALTVYPGERLRKIKEMSDRITGFSTDVLRRNHPHECHGSLLYSIFV
jgi:hypothetical protein